MINRFVRAICILITIGAVLVAGSTILAERAISAPVDANDEEIVEFEVPEGTGVTEIANLLRDDGLISQPLLFRLLAREQQVESLKAGTYRLRKNMTMSEIIALLAEERTGEGGEERTFTIIPGQRLEEIAQVMVDAGIAPDTEAFLSVARDVERFKAKHEHLADIPDDQTLEGYLFPDTYNVFETATIEEVIDRIITTGFDANYEQIANEITAQTGEDQTPNIHQIVTMASIIQREASDAEDMPHISYIFWRRLQPDTPEVFGRLQSDPTLQYVVGTAENGWWPDINETLTAEQINSNDNPYNTRNSNNTGLPPGPISAPTLDALRAAARPDPNRPDGSNGANDLYFISTCDTNEIKYEDTFADFQPIIDEYQQCVANQGN